MKTNFALALSVETEGMRIIRTITPKIEKNHHNPKSRVALTKNMKIQLEIVHTYKIPCSCQLSKERQYGDRKAVYYCVKEQNSPMESYNYIFRCLISTTIFSTCAKENDHLNHLCQREINTGCNSPLQLKGSQMVRAHSLSYDIESSFTLQQIKRISGFQYLTNNVKPAKD